MEQRKVSFNNSSSQQQERSRNISSARDFSMMRGCKDFKTGIPPIILYGVPRLNLGVPMYIT